MVSMPAPWMALPCAACQTLLDDALNTADSSKLEKIPLLA